MFARHCTSHKAQYANATDVVFRAGGTPCLVRVNICVCMCVYGAVLNWRCIIRFHVKFATRRSGQGNVPFPSAKSSKYSTHEFLFIVYIFAIIYVCARRALARPLLPPATLAIIGTVNCGSLKAAVRQYLVS